jgi:hypothetical protein
MCRLFHPAAARSLSPHYKKVLFINFPFHDPFSSKRKQNLSVMCCSHEQGGGAELKVRSQDFRRKLFEFRATRSKKEYLY